MNNILKTPNYYKNYFLRFGREWLSLNYHWLKAYRRNYPISNPNQKLPEPADTAAPVVAVQPRVPIAPPVNFFSLFPEARNLIINTDLQYAEWNITPTELYYLLCISLNQKAHRIFEFGTYNGATSYHLAKANPDSHIFTIDMPPYTSKFVTGGRFLGTPQEGQITQLIGDSKAFDYSEYLGTIDFVFIDADHEYAGAYSDSLTAFKLVKPGGIIVWDDYISVWPGVVQAVNSLIPQYPIVSIEGTKLALCIVPQ